MEWGPALSGFAGSIVAIVGAWAAYRKAMTDSARVRVDERAAVVAGYDTLVNQLQEQVLALAGRVAVLEAQREHDEDVINRQRIDIGHLNTRVAILEAELRALGVDPDDIGGVPI
jgi:hypothetical protein